MSYELRMERVIRAPRQAVFDAWTRPEALRRWFTPQPLGTGECRLDFRVGGEWVHSMLMPGGLAHTMRARFTAIEAPRRLVFEAGLEQLAGSHIVTTVTFEEAGAGTRVRVLQTFNGDIPVEDARAGWTSSLDQLQALAEGA